MLVADDRPVQRYSADWLRIEKQEMVLGVALRFEQHFRVEVADFTWFHNRNPHTYHLGFQHVKDRDIWIWGILDDIGRIHFFGFMLLVDQLNGCLCLSMESTWPLQGWLCPNLQPGDEDFRYFFKCIFMYFPHFKGSVLRNILWLRYRCVVFLAGLGLNRQVADL